MAVFHPTCEYCGVRSPLADVKECLACGAPLPDVKQPAAAASLKTKTQHQPISNQPTPMESVINLGRQTEDLMYTLLYTRSLFWRLTADAAVIAMVALAIGVVGGATRMGLWGLAAAGLLGFAVGTAIKGYLWTFLGAPIGVVLGAMVCALFWVVRLPAESFVFVLSAFTIWAARAGSLKQPFRQRRFIEKLRPFLGLAGGLAFGLLGNIVGSGLQNLAALWL